jgi:ABC-type nitrate/sulfonate/bicarbonate transport system substrate-binding protein
MVSSKSIPLQSFCRSRRMRTLLLVFLSLTTLAVGSASAEDVTIAVSSTSFVLGGVRIGEQAGLFEKNGLHPHIVVMESGNAAMAALIGGSVQFTVAGPGEVLAARARGQDVVIVANLYKGLAGSVVLSKDVAATLPAQASAPLAERLKALNGLSIAVPSATSALLAPVRNAAEAAGAHIRFSYMSQPAMVAALASKAVQGIDASFPFAGKPIIDGTGVLWINGPGDELSQYSPASSSCVQATAAFVKAHADTVQRLQQSVIDIASYVREHPAEAKQALAKGYSQLSPAEIDLSFSQQQKNWTKPFLDIDDIRHEIVLLKASANLPGLDAIDPASVLVAEHRR